MNFKLSSENCFSLLANANLLGEILKTNEESVEYGLFLYKQDAQTLIEASRESLSVQDRIEFGKSIVIKLINKFMKSSYISQSDYADTLYALIDIFYQVKEESLDVLTDDEVIDVMFDFYEKESGGSIEILQNRDMDYLCRKIRNTALGIANYEIMNLTEDADE